MIEWVIENKIELWRSMFEYVMNGQWDLWRWWFCGVKFLMIAAFLQAGQSKIP